MILAVGFIKASPMAGSGRAGRLPVAPRTRWATTFLPGTSSRRLPLADRWTALSLNVVDEADQHRAPCSTSAYLISRLPAPARGQRISLGVISSSHCGRSPRTSGAIAACGFRKRLRWRPGSKGPAPDPRRIPARIRVREAGDLARNCSGLRQDEWLRRLVRESLSTPVLAPDRLHLESPRRKRSHLQLGEHRRLAAFVQPPPPPPQADPLLVPGLTAPNAAEARGNHDRPRV